MSGSLEVYRKLSWPFGELQSFYPLGLISLGFGEVYVQSRICLLA